MCLVKTETGMMKDRQRQAGMMRKCVHCTSSLFAWWGPFALSFSPSSVPLSWLSPGPLSTPGSLPAGSSTTLHPTSFFLPFYLGGDRIVMDLEKSTPASTSSYLPGSLIPQECSQRANNGRFTLRDLLMVPMQRVLKYHLLLQVYKWGLPRSIDR